jgi:CelD/BcsL family acetyltransferase involved in cellulose biosynthesis
MLEHAYENGLDGFDFMRGDESYKFIWARGCRDNRRIRTKVDT